jgi:D-sedoheptulose 7-phosphate isomerase
MELASGRGIGETGTAMSGKQTAAKQNILNEVGKSVATLERVATDAALLSGIEDFARLVVECLRAGGKVLWCGNGGSAADAQHMAAEFVVRFTVNRPALASISLTVDTSIMTACANDFGYETVFARQVEALGRKGDVLVGMSTSGTSPTVLRALEAARALGTVTVGMTGETGGVMHGLCDLLLAAPATRTQNVQEAHLMIGHIVMGLVEQAMFPERFVAE